MTFRHDKAKWWRNEDFILIVVLLAFGTYISLPVGRSIGIPGYLIGPALSLTVWLFVEKYVRC